ncbi:hypothetical protein OG205_09385 [Lentzea sp. NBC_00516]|nr:hypothetical protein [Lentzea sp. NBC_00516]WUD27186.1 hypothetical protein OG205_09385 [Lentzea sp. NBC_00516]
MSTDDAGVGDGIYATQVIPTQRLLDNDETALEMKGDRPEAA